MSRYINQTATVPSDMHGQRADVALAALFSEYSRSQLSQWLKVGLITFNGKQLKPKEKVAGGDLVSLNVKLEIREDDLAEDIPLDIVYEDEAMIIINKPAGLVVHPGAGNPKHTLVNALLHHSQDLKNLPRAGIVHRLDKDTTGLLVIAKTLEAHTALVRMMQNREIHRQYFALVYGHVIAGQRIETFFGRHPRNRLKMAVTTSGKEAITDYTVNKQYSEFTYLDVKLLTGRTHQIRVHMAHINHPIVGDGLYGGRLKYPAGASEELKDVLKGFDRQALHAYYLSFMHPFTKEQMTFKAPLPSDFSHLLSTMDDYYECN